MVKLATHLGLAVLGSFLGIFLIFPGPNELALDALTLFADRPKAAVSLVSWDGMETAVEAWD